MCRTHVAHVCGVNVGAGAVDGGPSLLDVVSSRIQSLIQLPETGLQLARLTCTEATTTRENLSITVHLQAVGDGLCDDMH